MDCIKETSYIGLKFITLDVNFIKGVVLLDASYASAQIAKSRFGLVVRMVDNQNQSNVVQYRSSRRDRVS